MDESQNKADNVAASMRQVIENEAVRRVDIEVEGTRILISKGTRIGEELPVMDDPPQYPDVPTKLKDDEGSWLK